MSDSSIRRNDVQQVVRSAKPQTMPVMAHILCGWPLILLPIGGAIGGALGGLAYGVNLSLYKSNIPGVFKIMLNLLVGMMAIGGWLIIAAMILKR
jgi:hypothetical protein